MNKLRMNRVLLPVFIALSAGCSLKNSSDAVIILPPEELYGQLFYDVQSTDEIFSDSKTFVDCIPLHDVEKILADYSKLETKSSDVLCSFIKANFAIPENELTYQTDSADIEEHISNLWEVLKRPADKRTSGTLLPLPHPYLVPGGRFREIYYWDSYFTLLGLQADDQLDIIEQMVDNFSYLIDTYGFVPNGNRTYYLSRSQPPFYALMLSVLASAKGDAVYSKYLKYLEKEYEFWMAGADELSDVHPAVKRVVRLPDGEIMNRYWDDKDTPRAESYREDVKTAKEAMEKFPDRTAEEIYRNLRAAAESGWDFSSRWLSADDNVIFNLYTIQTTNIIPVDLNSLLYNLEYTIAKAYESIHQEKKAEAYRNKYEQRKKALLKYCWSTEENFFMDFNFKSTTHTNVHSLAGVFPLFFSIASQEQVDLLAHEIQNSFLKDGGVVTSLHKTGQQWDAPNGWAPLQWITIQGLRNYGHDSLANEVKMRWLKLNQVVYKNTYKLLEKYNVEDVAAEGGGGEYPNQDGFGWTNGVYQRLSKE